MRSKRGQSFTISTFICPECGQRFPLPRPSRSQRERGHIKDLWCPKCKEIQKFIEIRESDFVINQEG